MRALALTDSFETYVCQVDKSSYKSRGSLDIGPATLYQAVPGC